MILVTGSTGFLGKSFTDSLLEEGQNVRVLVRDHERAARLFPKAEVFRGDISDRESVRRAIKGAAKVVHLAGLINYKDRDRLYKVNYIGTRNVLDCSKNVDRFVFSSSVAVFGNVNGRADESTPCNPSEPYGESKLMAERLITASGIDSAMLRIAPVYGVGSPWFNRLLKMLSWGMPCPRTDNKVQLVHISDAVQGVRLSLERGRGVFIIADREPVKITHLAERLVTLLGRRYWTVPPSMIRIPATLMGMGSLVNTLMENRNYDITRAQRVLKFRPRAKLDRELKRMVDFYLSQR